MPAPRRILALLAAAALPGCYAYVPAEFATVPEGESVRIFLTVQETRALEDGGMLENITVGSPPAVEGTLMRRAEEQLFVRVPVGQRQAGFHSQQLVHELPIGVGGIVHVQRRTLNRTSTGLALGGAAALVGALVFFIMDDAVNAEQGQFPEPENFRAPRLTFPMR